MGNIKGVKRHSHTKSYSKHVNLLGLDAAAHCNSHDNKSPPRNTSHPVKLQHTNNKQINNSPKTTPTRANHNLNKPKTTSAQFKSIQLQHNLNTSRHNFNARHPQPQNNSNTSQVKPITQANRTQHNTYTKRQEENENCKQ